MRPLQATSHTVESLHTFFSKSLTAWAAEEQGVTLFCLVERRGIRRSNSNKEKRGAMYPPSPTRPQRFHA